MELKVAIFLANRIFHLAQFQSPLWKPPPPSHPPSIYEFSHERKEKVPVDYNESQRKISSPLPVSSSSPFGRTEDEIMDEGKCKTISTIPSPHPLFHVSINANLLEQCAIWFPRVVSPRLVVPASLVYRHERHRRTNGSCGMVTTSSHSRSMGTTNKGTKFGREANQRNRQRKGK